MKKEVLKMVLYFYKENVVSDKKLLDQYCVTGVYVGMNTCGKSITYQLFHLDVGNGNVEVEYDGVLLKSNLVGINLLKDGDISSAICIKTKYHEYFNGNRVGALIDRLQ